MIFGSAVACGRGSTAPVPPRTGKPPDPVTPNPSAADLKGRPA